MMTMCATSTRRGEWQRRVRAHRAVALLIAVSVVVQSALVPKTTAAAAAAARDELMATDPNSGGLAIQARLTGNEVARTGDTSGQFFPGDVVQGYELMELTGVLGVCNHELPASPPPRSQKWISSGATEESSSSDHSDQQSDTDEYNRYREYDREKAIVVTRGMRGGLDGAEFVAQDTCAALVDSRHREIVPVSDSSRTCSVDDSARYDRGYSMSSSNGGEDGGSKDVVEMDGPSLEYQCLLEDVDQIYMNINYRLRKKFAAGSHGEVWRASRPSTTDARRGGDKDETFILKRLFVERSGELMVEMGLREAHFGRILANEPHVARFVEYFFRQPTESRDDERTAVMQATPPPLPAVGPSLSMGESTSTPGSADSAKRDEETNTENDLWLVFYDEGISLRQYLYSARDSAHTAVMFEPSPFWEKLRSNTRGESVLQSIMRQLLEAVSSLHSRGITHRDIKPSNILVSSSNLEKERSRNIDDFTAPVVKLADFGSAVDDYTLRHLYGHRGPTQGEETREYQPPEVLFNEHGAPYDVVLPLAYDMWSVGVVFLEIVLGSPQVFMISARARARLDAKLRGKDEMTKRKAYMLHVFTHEFCLFQPTPYELHALWNKYALVSDGCHFGQFNMTIVERDPKKKGLSNRWGLDLMWKLLQWNPSQRISAHAALQHAFFKGPYVCHQTGRQFATKYELELHQTYLGVQRQRAAELALVVREKYELPQEFRCPFCHRNFSTIASCERHLTARKHDQASGSHFCKYEHSRLGYAIRMETEENGYWQTQRASEYANVGISLFQGKRQYMEDIVIIHNHVGANVSMYAVVDGHLGIGAARYVQQHLAELIFGDHFEAFRSESSLQSNFFEEVVLRQIFMELHEGFMLHNRKHADDSQDFSGCTLTVVLVFNDQNRIISANVGDSRSIFVTRTKEHHTGSSARVLTVDHSPNVPEERDRIESSGGFVSFEGLWRVVGQLAVSRSIGDHHLRKYVTAEPSIYRMSIDQPGFLVVASDGLWETMSSQDVAKFVLEKQTHQQMTEQDIADALIEEAYVRGSLDNIAIVLVNITPLNNQG